MLLAWPSRWLRSGGFRVEMEAAGTMSAQEGKSGERSAYEMLNLPQKWRRGNLSHLVALWSAWFPLFQTPALLIALPQKCLWRAPFTSVLSLFFWKVFCFLPLWSMGGKRGNSPHFPHQSLSAWGWAVCPGVCPSILPLDFQQRWQRVLA